MRRGAFMGLLQNVVFCHSERSEESIHHRDSSSGACDERSECGLKRRPERSEGMTRNRVFYNSLLIAAVLFIILRFSICFGEGSFRYNHKDKRDPFMPLIDKDGNLLPEMRSGTLVTELSLEGIVWAEEGKSYAIISGMVLQQGETLGEYTLRKIERRRVILTKAGEDFVMDLGSGEEK